MNEPLPVIVSGRLFDGSSPLGRKASLELDGSVARLVSAEHTWAGPVGELRVSPQVFGARRFVGLPNGFQLVCHNGPVLDTLPAASRSEGPVAWLEQRVGVAVAAVLATVAGIAAFYSFGLPRVADAVAASVAPERERALGAMTLAQLDKQLLSKTALDPPKLAEVQKGFANLTRGLPLARVPRLEFRNAPGIGPNAFALPGELIVVTDQLLTTCSIDETVGVLAHELGHVQHRHALRQLVQELGIATVAGALTGDGSNLSLSASTLPIVLLRAHYSQAFELEADAAGFALLASAGYSPELFASCLRRIAGASAVRTDGLLDYAASHPPTQDRVARAHAAALEFDRQQSRLGAPAER